jgi:hypothetical protein
MKPFITFRVGFLFLSIPISFWMIFVAAGVVVALFLALMAHEAAFEQAHPTHYHSMLGTP